MQGGYIFKRGKSWVVKFYEPFIGPDGQPAKRRVLKRLAPVCREYQTATSVKHLAADLLAPINPRSPALRHWKRSRNLSTTAICRCESREEA